MFGKVKLVIWSILIYIGGACGYGDLYYNGYGSHTTALSTTLFNDGAACGECYKIMCDTSTGNQYCISGASVIVTATNFCPPNYALSNKDGGWCNQPNQHFDMSQPAWETIGVRQGGIVPVLYQRSLPIFLSLLHTLTCTQHSYIYIKLFRGHWSTFFNLLC